MAHCNRLHMHVCAPPEVSTPGSSGHPQNHGSQSTSKGRQAHSMVPNTGQDLPTAPGNHTRQRGDKSILGLRGCGMGQSHGARRTSGGVRHRSSPAKTGTLGRAPRQSSEIHSSDDQSTEQKPLRLQVADTPQQHNTEIQPGMRTHNVTWEYRPE